ncbi:MAG: polysaccharide biosynthesis/export family protein [Pseudomonadota bacterium]
MKTLTPSRWLAVAAGLLWAMQHVQAAELTMTRTLLGTPNTATTMPTPGAVDAAAGVSPAPRDEPLAAPQKADRLANLSSDVFGAQLFTGAFARASTATFNPDYVVSIGDRIQVRMWGGYTFDGALVVDSQGNIFLPFSGPVRVLGVRNNDLQGVVEVAVRKVFRANVSSYASLSAAQPVRIYVGGAVKRPGMYHGTSFDSLLNYLDQAGGIDPERGSFLNVQVKRDTTVRATVSLYEFLLNGRIPQVQLSDGDVIFIQPRQKTVKVLGLVENVKRFEFSTARLSLVDALQMAKPMPQATHVRVVRNTGTVRNVDYVELPQASSLTLDNGDEVELVADKKPGTITVRVEGEHQSAQEYVLPYGARFGELMRNIRLSERSEGDSVQLFRRSVAERQKAVLGTALRSLEASVLTARSGTTEEARLRKDEADLVLQWVERARKVEPTGQVVIAQAEARDQLLLENGDVVRIPTRDGLVLIGGEVLFPSSLAHDPQLKVRDYLARAGGYTQNADSARLVLARRDGSFTEVGESAAVRSGDEILVLPKLDVKSRQIWKELLQSVYQVVFSAKVVFGL